MIGLLYLVRAFALASILAILLGIVWPTALVVFVMGLSALVLLGVLAGIALAYRDERAARRGGQQ